ncbi:MAG: hypothetical protein J6W13_04310 [Salinivirgaceae bacterium]|nr:hypothetical protein [Salinivirgaceae bacterium]
MKNVLLMAFALFLCGGAQSQVVAKNYIFKPNRAGSYVVITTVSHNQDLDLCREKLEAWAKGIQGVHYSGSILGMVAESAAKKRLISYKDSVVTFMDNLIYREADNPFAGKWTETLNYTCDVKIEQDKIICTFHDMNLTFNYSGYGSSTKKYSLDEKYYNYLKAIDDLNNANSDNTMDKKERKKIIKDSENEISEDEKSFAIIDKKMASFIDRLERSFKSN